MCYTRLKENFPVDLLVFTRFYCTIPVCILSFSQNMHHVRVCYHDQLLLQSPQVKWCRCYSLRFNWERSIGFIFAFGRSTHSANLWLNMVKWTDMSAQFRSTNPTFFLLIDEDFGIIVSMLLLWKTIQLFRSVGEYSHQFMSRVFCCCCWMDIAQQDINKN